MGENLKAFYTSYGILFALTHNIHYVKDLSNFCTKVMICGGVLYK